MPEAILEHANITVPDPVKTARIMCEIFGWHIRWQGAVMGAGYTVHVGTKTAYLAFYNPGEIVADTSKGYSLHGGLNHIGVTVEDLDATETRVRAAGFTPHSHADYEPGQRFYFTDHDGVEFEVVSYKGA